MVFLRWALDLQFEMNAIVPFCWTLVISELYSIPTFVTLEVFFHQGPRALPSEACDFHFRSSLPVWQYGVKGFGVPKAIPLLPHTPERKELIGSAFCMWFCMPKELPLTFLCQSRFDFATTLLSKLQSALLKASASPFVGALYIEDLHWANLNFSQRAVTSLLTNGLPLSVIIYRGTPYR